MSKRFGSVHALHGVTFDIASGKTAAILGANGSGKSTLLRLIAGLARPSAGQIQIMGEDPRKRKASIGFLGHETYLYPYLTVIENLRFYSRLYRADEDRVGLTIETMGISSLAGSAVHTLSRGQTQRAAIARALLHDPDILLLDEPYTGLDRHGSAQLQTWITRPHRTTILVTHDADRANFADLTLELSDGRLL
ncbi:MAG: heme ABC exporter ATP-binding protein CcmA [Actinomycetota bacterium]